MSEKRTVFVVMTASGRVQDHSDVFSIQDVLEKVYREHLSAGRHWDRPTKLFIDGQCIIPASLTDVALEYGKFCEARNAEVRTACEAWVQNRLEHISREAAA